MSEQQSKFAGSRRRVPFIVGIVTFIALIGSGGAWAYWSASVSSTGSLSTQSVSVSHMNFPTLSATYLLNSLQSTGTFTVTNTGQANGVATVRISGAGSLAAQMPIKVWTVANASTCDNTSATPGGAVAGTWGTGPSLTPSISAGQSVVYCVRTTIPDWTVLATPTGAQSTQPQVSVSLNSDGWIATTATATNTQQTQGMFPLSPNFFDPTLSRWFTIRSQINSGVCLDVEGSGGAGSENISYSCHGNSNQRWEFRPVSGTNQSLVTIHPRHALVTSLSYNSDNTEVLQSSSSSLSQRWYVQQVPGSSSDTVRLVNAENGRCFGMRSTSSGLGMPTVTCSDPTSQIVLRREPLTFSQTGTSVRFTFGGSNVSGTVTLQRWNGSAWVAVGTAAISAQYLQYTYTTTDAALGTHLPVGDTKFRILNTGNVVLWGDIVLNRVADTVTSTSGIG